MKPEMLWKRKLSARSRMARAFVLLLGISLLLAVFGCQTSRNAAKSGSEEEVKVTRAVDGDTVEVQLQGKKETVRMIGIDTPETKKPNTPVMFYGPEAAAYTKKRLEGKNVRLEFDVDRKDQYDRLLAYIWIGDELFNETLVRQGYARIYTFPPNVKYVERFKKAQEEARKQGVGIWQDYDKAFDKK